MAFDYHIELRSKSGQLVSILKREVFDLFWRYDALGGCGECEIALRRDFDNYGDIGLDYDVQLQQVADSYPRRAGGFDVATFPVTIGGALGAEGTPLPAALPFRLTSDKDLRYSGFVRAIRPVFDNTESVRLMVAGYSRQLQYITVHDGGGPKNYASQDVGAIARSIIDTFVLPGTKIFRTPDRNLCQDTGVSVSATGLTFFTSAYEALETLAAIGGNAEWGVLPNREVFFMPRSTAVKQTWVLGDRILFYATETSTDEIVNRVFLQGGGANFILTHPTETYQAGYQKERVVLVSSVANAGDATLWGTAYFARFGSSQPKGQLRIGAIAPERSGISDFIERQPNQAMPSLGRLRVIGAPIFLRAGAALPVQLPAELTTSVAGGTTDQSFRIHSILYKLIEGGLAIDVTLGEKGGGLADYMKTIEFKLSELRQAA